MAWLRVFRMELSPAEPIIGGIMAGALSAALIVVPVRLAAAGR